MGFIRDVFGGGERPDPLPQVQTPAGNALAPPLRSALRGEGFNPVGEAKARRSRTQALRRSFVGGQRGFRGILNRTLQLGDVGARKVATDLREQNLNLGLERVRDSGAAINFEQRLQAQDIGLNVASNELATNQTLSIDRTNSKLRRIFNPDFSEGIAGGISGGIKDAAEIFDQARNQRDVGATGQGDSSFSNPSGIIESQAPSTDFFSRFSKAFLSSP